MPPTITAAPLHLRDYQRAAVDSWTAWTQGRRGMRAAEVLPTGTGKTVILGAVALDWHHWLGRSLGLGRRVLVIAHRTELIEQAAAKIADMAPGLSVGIVKAQRNETRADIIVASVQTLAGALRRRMIRDVGLVIVDECHHATAATYLDVLAHFGAIEPAEGVTLEGAEPFGAARALGLTATLIRGDGAALGAVWQDMIYRYTISDAIRAGWLVRPRGLLVRVDGFDLGKVKTVAGEYVASSLGAAIVESNAPEAVAKALTEHAADRRGIIFTPDVASAVAVQDAVRAVGFTAAVVHGKTPDDERRAALADFRARRLQWLCNCMIFTEGTDLPMADTVVIATATKSPGKYIQMAGRALRPDLAGGKTDALLIDMVGATQAHSLHAPASLFGEDLKKRRAKGEHDEETDLLDDLIGLGAVDDPDYAAPIHSPNDRAPRYVGPLVAHEVDLFHSSAMEWNRTFGGIWFLAAGERYIAVVPSVEVGRWDVTTMGKKVVGSGAWIAQGVSELAYAMAYAEDAVAPAERMTAARGRQWQAKKPSEPQRDLGLKMRLPVDGMTSGELSRSIEQVFASRRIDPKTPEYARGRS